MLISVQETGKNWLQPWQGNMGKAKKSVTKPPGVLEHCREEETN